MQPDSNGLIKIEIDVTEQDILEGQPKECGLCPIAMGVARAFQKAFPDLFVSPSVGRFTMSVYGRRRDQDGNWSCFIFDTGSPLPQMARRFVTQFDKGDFPRPFKFTQEFRFRSIKDWQYDELASHLPVYLLPPVTPNGSSPS